MSTVSNGHLDTFTGWEHAKVEYYEYGEPKTVWIHGGYGDMENDSIRLDAGQALALLTWLIQERPTLEQLAKEQPE